MARPWGPFYFNINVMCKPQFSERGEREERERGGGGGGISALIFTRFYSTVYSENIEST